MVGIILKSNDPQDSYFRSHYTAQYRKKQIGECYKTMLLFKQLLITNLGLGAIEIECFVKLNLSLLLNFNPIAPNAPFVYPPPLKISENLMVFKCFQGVEKGCIGNE